MSHTTNKKISKKASTEHAKSADVSYNNKKNKKKQTKRPQQNMINQLMSHTTNKKAKNKQKGLNRTC